MKKYKAEAPICTIGKIRKILSDIGILLLEQHLIHDNFSSCRVTFGNNGLDKLNIGTNGKGRTFEYSLASGYAEFMERLENHQTMIGLKKMPINMDSFCVSQKMQEIERALLMSHGTLDM